MYELKSCAWPSSIFPYHSWPHLLICAALRSWGQILVVVNKLFCITRLFNFWVLHYGIILLYEKCILYCNPAGIRNMTLEKTVEFYPLCAAVQRVSIMVNVTRQNFLFSFVREIFLILLFQYIYIYSLFNENIFTAFIFIKNKIK